MHGKKVWSICILMGFFFFFFIGSLKHAYVYSKVTKAWVVKKMHQQKTYSFRDAIFSDVVSRRSQVEDQINMRDKMVRVDKPNLPRNMAETTKGDKESAILDYCQKKKQVGQVYCAMSLCL